MIKTTKRALAYILLVCMLLTVLPLNVFAATSYSFNFGGWAADGTNMSVGDGPADGSKSWELVAKSDGTGGTASINVKNGVSSSGNMTYIRWKNQGTDSFVAYKLNGIAAGTYNMDFSVDSGNTGGAAANIYVMPASELPAAAGDIVTKLAGMTPAGKVGCYDQPAGKDPTSISNVAFTGSSDGSYAVVFLAAENAGKVEIKKTTFKLCGITLTASSGSADTPATTPSTPAATKPAATEPDTDPTTGTAAPEKDVSVRVNWEVAIEDPVSQSYFTHAATGVVNGHDYLYLGLRGGKLVIYDIDEKKQVNAINTGNDAPRYILVDENGFAWITSAKGMLCYNPFTNTYEEALVDSKLFDKGMVGVLGMVSDGNGKIYFGSLNHGYIGYYDTATKKSYCISEWLGVPGHEKDTKEGGYGGLAYKDGYLYLGIDGDMNEDGKKQHALIKYDIANQKIVDFLDISFAFDTDNKYLQYVKLIDNTLFCSFSGGNPMKVSFFVDISGNKMKFTDIPNLNAGHSGGVTEKVDGKIYFSSYFGEEQLKGIVEYDLTNNTTKMLWEGNQVLRSEGNHFVTIEGDDRLPGQSIVIPVNDEAAGVINLRFFNPQTKQMVDFEANIGLTGGVGANIRGLVTDETGRYIYIGAWANNAIAKYDTVEGKVVDTFKSYSHQTDDLEYLDGYLYAGNYSAGTITRINTETKEVQPLFSLRYSVFEQCRMHSLAVGGNKAFCGTVPYTGMGGVLVWYDFDKNLTYVAAGPNPEDVFYADTTKSIDPTTYTWYNVVTGEAMDFDDDDDGKDDVYLADGTRRFSGLIKDQVVNNLIYKDGYLYGTSSVSGASGTFPEEYTQALLFVYDVAAMKVIATCDLADHLEGFTNQIPYLDQLAEDPEEPGKFWGVIDDTLYTMTFDLESKTFHIKEEFSIKKEQYYSLPGSGYNHRDMCFAGDYIYVGFGRNTGTYMVRKIDTSERYLVNEFSPNCMVVAADGNLYWTSNASAMVPHNLNMFPVGEKAAPLLAKAPLDTAQRLINALPDKITKDDKAAIDAARKAYDKLTDEEKAKITNLDKLIAAEEAFAKLPTFNMTIVYVAIAAVVVLAGAAVVVVLVLKKKKKNAPDAE